MLEICGYIFFSRYSLISLLKLSHQLHAVLKSDLVRFSHFRGGSIAHAVENFVKYFNLLLAQSVFKRGTEPVKLV